MKDNVFLKKLNKENVLTIILVLFLVLWRIPFLNKGIDYTDTGFSMENYKNLFFSDGIKSIGRFYTVVLGGFIYKLLPSYHLLVYRILHWVLNLLTYFFAYKVFKKFLNKNIILIGLIAISFSGKAGEALFSYYPLTACLLLLSIWLMTDGIAKQNKLKIFLSGLISGLNIFVRLPNVLFLCMIVALFVYVIRTKGGVRKAFQLSILYAVGAVSSLAFSLVIMALIMGIDGVIGSFMRYVELALGKTPPGIENFLGIDEVSHHSVFASLWTVVVQVWKSIKSLVVLLPAVLICFGADKLLKNKIKKYWIFVIKLIVCVAWFVFTCSFIANSILHTLYLAAILSGMIVIVLLRKDAEIVMINIITILVSACSVFGSDAGLTRMNIAGSLLVLVFIMNVYKIADVLKSENCLLKNAICLGFNVKNVLIIAVITASVFNTLPKTYNDANYLDLKYPVNPEISVLKGMITSEIRAEQINEYYEIMSSSELCDKEVAIFGFFPLGVVIGNQKDYFEAVQPCIDYPGVSVKKLLKNIMTKDAEGVKPILVASYVHMQQANTEKFTSDAKEAVFNYMLGLYDYKVYSDSEHFTVYVPAEN